MVSLSEIQARRIAMDSTDVHAVRAVRMLNRYAGGNVFLNLFRSDEAIEKSLPSIAMSKDIYYGLVADSELIAAASVRHRFDGFQPASRSKVDMFAVEPEWRLDGHGRRLMQYVARAALEIGDTVLCLRAAPNAVPFYEKLGFERQEEMYQTNNFSIDAELLV